MDIQIQHFKGEEVCARREDIQRFMHSLKEEKLTFSLDYEQIVEAKELYVATDAEGNWLGLGGYRLKKIVALFFLVIHRDVQNKGLGKQITLKVLKNISFHQLLLLSVSRSNTGARRLYDEVGFITLCRTKTQVTMGLNKGYLPLLKPFLILMLKIKNWGN